MVFADVGAYWRAMYRTVPRTKPHIKRVTCCRCGYEQPWAGGCECDAMAHVPPPGSVYAAAAEHSFEFRQKCRAFSP